MRTFLSLAFASALLAASPLPTKAATLQGPMARFQVLSGSWKCNSVVTMPRGERQKLSMNMTFDVVAPTVLHDHLSAGGFDAHLYYGYDSARKRYWATTANGDGTQLQQTSSDGLFYSGSIVQHPNVRITDRFAFDATGFTIHDVTTVKAGDIVTDSVCTRLALRLHSVQARKVERLASNAQESGGSSRPPVLFGYYDRFSHSGNRPGTVCSSLWLARSGTGLAWGDPL
jgi:hypothetical protein